MPVHEPRSRSLNREWRADREWMTEFTAAEREYAMLLGLHADDAGWVQWDLGTLLADIYRWETPKRRETFAEKANTHLVATGRLAVQPCGRHAVLRKLVDRPRHGKAVFTVAEEHVKVCAPGKERLKSDQSPTEDPALGPTEVGAGSDQTYSVALLSDALHGAGARDVVAHPPASGLRPIADLMPNLHPGIVKGRTDA